VPRIFSRSYFSFLNYFLYNITSPLANLSFFHMISLKPRRGFNTLLMSWSPATRIQYLVDVLVACGKPHQILQSIIHPVIIAIYTPLPLLLPYRLVLQTKPNPTYGSHRPGPPCMMIIIKKAAKRRKNMNLITNLTILVAFSSLLVACNAFQMRLKTFHTRITSRNGKISITALYGDSTSWIWSYVM